MTQAPPQDQTLTTDGDNRPSPATGPLQGAGLRTALYTVALTVAAVWVMFTNLGGPRIEGDEARYALCADQIRRTGEWLSLSPHPPMPYFEKPPLYMWLTAATYRVVPGFELKYRAWSAAFGVACVGLTCVLGAVLLSPEAGLLGGALLLTNRPFLLEHGARHGGMDAGLTMLLLVVLLLYWVALTRQSALARWGSWAGIGAAAGLACLFKPLIGVPMLLPVAAHLLLATAFPRRIGYRPSWVGLLLAVLVMAAAAAPWYLVQWRRFGQDFADAMFGRSLYQRVTVGLHRGHVAGPLYYVTEISTSSVPFALFLPAVAFVAVAAVVAFRARRGRDAAALTLLAVVGIGWVGLFSLSRSKFLHYAYPAFPAIALSLAALFAAAVGAAAAQVRDRAAGGRVAAAAWLALGAVLLVACCRLGYSVMPQQQKKYVPWEIYEVFQPAVADGRMRLVFWDVPAAPEQWGDETAVNSADMFYLGHMRGVTRVSDGAGLARLLNDRRPTLAFLSRMQNPPALYNAAGLPARFDDRFVYEHRAFTVAAIDTGGLMHHQLSPASGQWENPYLKLRVGRAPVATAGGSSATGPASKPGGFPFEGGFTVSVTPPLPEDCRLTVTVRPAAGAGPRRVRRVVRVGDDRAASEPVPFPFEQALQLAAVVERDPKRPGAARDVQIRLESADDRYPAEPVRGVVSDVRLAVQPRVPVGNPGRAAAQQGVRVARSRVGLPRDLRPARGAGKVRPADEHPADERRTRRRRDLQPHRPRGKVALVLEPGHALGRPESEAPSMEGVASASPGEVRRACRPAEEHARGLALTMTRRGGRRRGPR